MAANKHDISGLSGGNERINGTTMIDAAQKLGDAKGKLRAVAMHSATEAALAKVNQIVYIMESANSDRVPTYHGRTVIVDDDLPVDTVNGIYTTYFFGPGAVGYAEGIIGNGPMEQDRDILVGGRYHHAHPLLDAPRWFALAGHACWRLPHRRRTGNGHQLDPSV